VTLVKLKEVALCLQLVSEGAVKTRIRDPEFICMFLNTQRAAVDLKTMTKWNAA
jgi:hypothetical protein